MVVLKIIKREGRLKKKNNNNNPVKEISREDNSDLVKEQYTESKIAIKCKENK